MSKPAKILLADDQALYCAGLTELFRHWSEFAVVGCASNGKDAITLARSLRPDIVLMDIVMPVMDGVVACKKIIEDNPDVSVVMLTLYGERERILASIEAGANGYLLKSIEPQQLRSELLRVLDGRSVLSNELVEICFNELRQRSFSIPYQNEAEDIIVTLTEEDRELLRLLAVGASNKEIGNHLFLVEGTIKKKISILLAKIGVANRVQAAIFAIRSGIAK